mgnify:CR=1 FL=1|jgi:hypothetical protein|tara:strand:- start:645 stop:884 length:240 start_codon:yes stop_codon:yes gene_type:complete
MSKKYLYIVEHFQPFPSSEYGGIWNVIAKDDNECFNLIVNEDNNQYSEHYNKLYANIIKAEKFALADDYESSVIEAFLT